MEIMLTEQQIDIYARASICMFRRQLQCYINYSIVGISIRIIPASQTSNKTTTVYETL